MPIDITDRPNKTLLVIDPSSSHLAYVLAVIDQNELVFHKVGMLWTHADWTVGQRLLYMFESFKVLLEQVPPPDSVYTESFFANFKMKTGMSMIPTVNNLLKMAIAKDDKRTGFSEISPSSWRKTLGIKPVLTTEGKDWKLPTKLKVEELIGVKLPELIQSNITEKQRALPHDITDAMAISIAIGTELKCSKFTTVHTTFLNPILLGQLRKVKENVE